MEAENPAYTCKDACDCGPAHCCKGGICVKDTIDPWKPGGTAIGSACTVGKDATYCCAVPECHPGKFASDVAARPFRCHSRSKGKALSACTGKSCFGTACNCSAGESCVDTSHGMPPGKTCLLLEGGTCVSNALAQTVYGFKASDLLPCCGAGCLKGAKCDAGWQRSGGTFGYQRVIGTCGSCGNGFCDPGEYPGTCAMDCTCGDGRCAPSELVSGCSDCKKCGDGKCQAWETPVTCAKDCASCGDSWCSGTETALSCAQDCGTGRCPDAVAYQGTFRACGDKHCAATGCGDPETCLTCPQDCGPCEKGWRELHRTTGWMTNRLKAVWGASSSAVFAVGDGGVLRFDGQRWGPMMTGEKGLLGVWGTSATNVFAVGSGKILRYDGKVWTRSHAGGGNGLWGASPTDVFAVGGNILRYDGATWKTMKKPTSEVLKEVWGTSASDVFAVGARVILHYDGAQWSTMKFPTPNQYLNGVWGTSPTNVFAVGATLLHYNGSKWTQVSKYGYSSVWGTSATHVLFVGHRGILHYDGSNWSLHKPNSFVQPFAAWGISSTAVHVVGTYNNYGSALLRFDGTKFDALAMESNDEYRGVWATSPSDLYVAGVTANGYAFMRWDGTAWTSFGDSGPGMFAVWGTSPTHVLACGEDNAFLRHDGSKTSIVPTGLNNHQYCYALWGSTATDIVMAGDGLYRHDGVTWDKLSKGGTAAAVWGSSTSQMIAVALNGNIRSFNGVSWKPMTSPTTKSLHAVWGASSTCVFATGSVGTILRYDGVKWSPMASPITSHIQAVWGSSPTNVFATGGGGKIIRFDGSKWTTMASPAKTTLNALWGSSATNVFAAGYSGTIVHHDGVKWTTMASGVTTTLYGLWGSSATDVWAVGGGSMLRYDGNMWKTVHTMQGTKLRVVWGTSPTDVHVGGNLQQSPYRAVAMSFDGASWTSATLGMRWVKAIWSTPGGSLFAAMESGLVYRRNGKGWTFHSAIDLSSRVRGIWGSSATNVYLAAEGGAVWRLNGKVPSVATPGTGWGLASVWGTSASAVWAVGAGGTVLHHDGAKWSPQPSGSTAYLKGVNGSSATDVYVVGGLSPMLRYNGKSWDRVRQDLRQASSAGYSCPSLNAVYGLPSGDVFMVGSHETVLRRCPAGKCP